MNIRYDAFEDKLVPHCWRCEAIDTTSGECYVVLFSGPNSEYLAKEYARFKNDGAPMRTQHVVRSYYTPRFLPAGDEKIWRYLPSDYPTVQCGGAEPTPIFKEQYGR